MIIELYIFSIAIIIYGLFVTLAIIGFNRVRLTLPKLPSVFEPKQQLSIVIAARNEKDSIVTCLQQFEQQHFPKDKFEIILIDDASEDDTFLLAEEFLNQSSLQFKIIQSPFHQGKKAAISHAISLSSGSIIITSDADIVYRHPDFLKTVSSYFENYEPSMLVMPIDFQVENNILNAFQVTENIALTGFSVGFLGINNPFLCSGANLAFDKKAFLGVNGYQSHLNISSGEDVLLLEDLKKKYTSKRIHYGFHRALIAKTLSEKNLSSFFNQRIRWASKAKYNPNVINSVLGFVVIVVNLLILAAAVSCINKPIITPYLVTFVTAKFIFDFLLLFLAADFLSRVKYLKWFIPFQMLYGLYAFVIGLGSFFIKPQWKNKIIKYFFLKIKEKI